jgi:DNA primase
MTPLEVAWEHYGGTLMGTSGKVKAKCPLHMDTNASARVDTLEQKWVCYAGCGHGDIFELIKLADGIDKFPECKEIADRLFGAPSPDATEKPRNRKRPGRRKPAWVGDQS